MATPFWDDVVGPDASQMELGLYARNPWDLVKIDGVRLPGICEVTANPALRFDQKQSAGKHGSKIDFTGYRPTKIEILVHIWTDDQLASMDSIIEVLWPVIANKNPTPTARRIEHPALNALHVKTCAVVGVVPYRPSGKVPGGKQVMFQCLEYEPIGKKTATGTVAPPKIAAKLGQSGANFTTVDNKQVAVKPANAQPAAPSQSSVDTGPVSQSLPPV